MSTFEFQPFNQSKKRLVVVCRLPAGFNLDVPHETNPQIFWRVPVRGAIHGSADNPNLGYGVTLVDEEFYKRWLEIHDKMLMVKNHAIFSAKDEFEAAAKMKDARNQDIMASPMI